MSIDFSADRWQAVKKRYGAWWKGELERPLIPLIVRDRDPGRPQPDAPMLKQSTCADLSVSADQLIDRIDYELSCCSFFGDAFPFFGMACFGPGVLAAFLGAKLDNSTGRVWFHAPDERDIRDLHFTFNPDNVWFRRVSDIYAAGMKRWQGQVLMGMTDMGGILDVLSTFRPSDKLLLDLYDHPEEVTRLSGELHEAWFQCYEALNNTLQPHNPGYSDWSGIYSDRPSYVPQCDFCYMIGPEMFDDLVKPELAATCARLPNTIYHLDGTGQLPHLDSLLTIDPLKAVQWVPGTGKPDCANWPDVYGKIQAAGKLMQLYGDFDVLDAVSAQLGSARGIHLKDAVAGDRESAITKLAKYGIE